MCIYLQISDVLALLGGVALFLFGMSLMGDGLKKVAGSKLEVVLYKLTSNPLKGMLLGTGITAIIQSSSATSVMVVGFVNSGMMKVAQAIGIIMGAILGTSVTGWILCLSDMGGSGLLSLLSTSTLTSLVALVGIILRMFTKKQRNHYLGDILLGFAVLMFGMQAMSGAVEPLRESPLFLNVITSFANPILGILVGAAFTAVIQSASAAVGILQALAITGAIDFSVALPILMGVAIGASVPVILSSVSANTAAKRSAFVYLLVAAAGALVWGVVFYTVSMATELPFLHRQMTTVSIALVNTLYRLAVIVPLAPAIGLLERIVCKLFPEKPEDLEASADMDRLEDRFLAHPALAVEQCRLTINAMAEKAQRNLEYAFGLLGYFSEENFRKVENLESVIDRYEDKLGTYLMKLTGKELDPRLSHQVSKYLHTLGDFERLSDHALNIAESAREIAEKNLQFSDAGMVELDVLTGAVVDVMDLAVRSFVNDDAQMACRVEPLEEHIDNLCDEMKLHHVERLQSGGCTLMHGFVFNDLLTNYERIADHCSNIAVAIVELESDTYDTHEYLNSIKDQRSAQFQRYLEEYSQKYSL